jgi:cell division protein FtsI/penicillin-binding protein 2
MKAFFYAVVVIGAFLLWRLYDVQLLHGRVLASAALDQRSSVVDILARRGTLYDRNLAVLARSMPSEGVYAVPNKVRDPEQTAAKLSPVVGRPVDEIFEALTDYSVQFRWVARKVSHGTADAIRALRLAGIGVSKKDTGVRKVPSGRLAANVIGFVGLDENGLDGLEYSFDDYLRGHPGKISLETEEAGDQLPFDEPEIVEAPRPGRSLVLTIDSSLQFEAERALSEAVKKYSARSGSAVVLDPESGEILALANAPDFDPTAYAKASDDERRDRAVIDAYEPGSTFKLITAAAALESGKVRPDSRFPALDEVTIGGHTIHNAEDGFPAGTGGTETLEDIIAYSHNVGAAEVGMAIGSRALAAQIERFGFGKPTEIELPGENPGIVPPVADWSGTSLPTISFGHGISTTPLALARAYAAIANGGVLLRPRVIRELLDEQGRPIYEYNREVEGRAISADTAAALRRFLVAVVTRGTGNPTARVPGYTTAGKTGTAQVVENGGYAPGQYIASFAGFIPADHPRYVIVVKVEKPRGAIYGSVVAAPVFARIAQFAMLHAGVLPDESLMTPPPK